MTGYSRPDALLYSSRKEPLPRVGEARRGFIPRPESPAEKVARLQQAGYYTELADRQLLEETEFSKYNLGNPELPAYKHKQEILQTIRDNRISLLAGPTGSGKTTQLAQFALEAGYDRIIYLEPRRVNVDGISERLIEELAEHLGDDKARQVVGMAHSERATLSDRSIIQVMTSGSFTRMVRERQEAWQDEKVLIVADETHENNLETEFAAAYAVRAVEKNESWRMVFASATPDVEALTSSYEAINGQPVPMVTVEGRPHDLAMEQEPAMDIVDAYIKHSVGVDKSMIFVDGKRSINDTISEIHKRLNKHDAAHTRFFKLHAEVSQRVIDSILNMELAPGERGVVVSTSAGQSGITIPGVKLVVTSGVTKSPELDNELAEGLPKRLCTQAEIVQQGGRAGRDVAGGTCVLARPLEFQRSKHQGDALYEFTPLDERPMDMPPEIYHSNIARNVLTAAAMGENFHVFNNYLKNSVQAQSIREAYDVLFQLGAVDGNEAVTDLGRLMETFPLRPELSRAVAEVVQGKSLTVQAHTLAIAAAVEAGGLADFDTGNGTWRSVLRGSTKDDFIAQLDMMKASRPYFRGRSVDEAALIAQGLAFKRVYQAHRQLDKMARQVGFDIRDIDWVDPTPDEEGQLYDIFLTGMADLVYKRTGTGRHKVPQYENVWSYEQALTREISDRSLMRQLGRASLKLVAGYPRWYVDSYDNKRDIIDMGFPVEYEQVRRVLGSVASQHLSPSIRGDKLVRSGVMKLGSLDLGPVSSFESRSDSLNDRQLLVDAMLREGTPAVETLRAMGVNSVDIEAECMRQSRAAHSIYEVDSRLWTYVTLRQAK